KEMRITVSGDRSFEAAMRLQKEDLGAKIAVMNFANAFHAGGGARRCLAAPPGRGTVRHERKRPGRCQIQRLPQLRRRSPVVHEDRRTERGAGFRGRARGCCRARAFLESQN
ncbi:MAG: DUF2263 domain-containing protein, partial [Pyramidobacter sp.]|nr:DUF2263 domain-containing protein [Pyramidobacter sp.]